MISLRNFQIDTQSIEHLIKTFVAKDYRCKNHYLMRLVKSFQSPEGTFNAYKDNAKIYCERLLYWLH